MENTPKYFPGDCVNIEIEVVETIIARDPKTGKDAIKYRVKPSDENSCLNFMTIKESSIQD